LLSWFQKAGPNGFRSDPPPFIIELGQELYEGKALLVANRFQKRRRKRVPIFFYLISILICAIAVFELYRWIVPFQSQNPLFHEVTIGESVIDSWKYGGQDEEGYLRFYNDQQTVVLPPNAHLFDANGQFVVIEHYAPASLTYAEPFAAIPPKWMIAMFATLVVFIGSAFLRIKHRPRKLGKHKPIIHADEAMSMWQKLKPHPKLKRFQSRTRKAKWNFKSKP
jgi:hypothetical protein